MRAACKPNSVRGPEDPWTAIPLGPPSPAGSSNLPGGFLRSCRRGSPKLARRAGTRGGRMGLGLPLPPYLVLLRVGFTLPPAVAVGAVRSYRTFSPLPSQFPGKAVFSLWHWPSRGLDAAIPDVIRHTALRSSDFPPPFDACARTAAAVQPPAPSVYPGRFVAAPERFDCQAAVLALRALRHQENCSSAAARPCSRSESSA